MLHLAARPPMLGPHRAGTLVALILIRRSIATWLRAGPTPQARAWCPFVTRPLAATAPGVISPHRSPACPRAQFSTSAAHHAKRRSRPESVISPTPELDSAAAAPQYSLQLQDLPVDKVLPINLCVCARIAACTCPRKHMTEMERLNYVGEAYVCAWLTALPQRI